jgi:hypothetical protein
VRLFEQLHVRDQILLLARCLEAIQTETPDATIAALAGIRGCTVLDVWRDICRDCVIDECEPWQGFPEGPGKLPPTLGDNEMIDIRILTPVRPASNRATRTSAKTRRPRSRVRQ